jgi:hypothetical protein
MNRLPTAAQSRSNSLTLEEYQFINTELVGSINNATANQKRSCTIPVSKHFKSQNVQDVLADLGYKVTLSELNFKDGDVQSLTLSW